MLAVADRGAPRDFVDLAALVERRGYWKAYSGAVEKHPGLHPRQLLYAFRYFGDLDRSRFQIPDASPAQLQDTVDGWRRDLTRRLQGRESDMRLAPVGGPPSDLAAPPRLEFRPPADDTGCPTLNPISVSVRPHRAANKGWELLIRGMAASPLWVSDPYPTKEEAEGQLSPIPDRYGGSARPGVNSWRPVCPPPDAVQGHTGPVDALGLTPEGLTPVELCGLLDTLTHTEGALF